jgi:hypothetical protein
LDAVHPFVRSTERTLFHLPLPVLLRRAAAAQAACSESSLVRTLQTRTAGVSGIWMRFKNVAVVLHAWDVAAAGCARSETLRTRSALGATACETRSRRSPAAISSISAQRLVPRFSVTP